MSGSPPDIILSYQGASLALLHSGLLLFMKGIRAISWTLLCSPHFAVEEEAGETASPAWPTTSTKRCFEGLGMPAGLLRELLLGTCRLPPTVLGPGQNSVCTEQATVCMLPSEGPTVPFLKRENISLLLGLTYVNLSI